MKITALGLLLMVSAVIDGTTGFVRQVAPGHGVAFGLEMAKFKEGYSKTPLDSTDFVSKQLINLLEDPSFKGPVHEAEKKARGYMMRNLVRAITSN